MSPLIEPLAEPIWWAMLGPLIVVSLAAFGLARGAPSEPGERRLPMALAVAVAGWLALTPIAGLFADRVLSGG